MTEFSLYFVIAGAAVLLCCMVWYYHLLVYMKGQIYEKKTFNHWVYGLSFAMISFFFAGYIYVAVMLSGHSFADGFPLVSIVFFFGALFVLCMVGVQQKMVGTITSKTVEVIRSMISSIEAKDAYTKGHSEHVYRLSALIYGYLPSEVKSTVNFIRLKDAAMLHDIGKIGIPDNILNKPGRLTEDEFKIIKTHPHNGKTILEKTSYREIADLVLYHHERVDGRGYYGLSGDAIPIESKIIAVADTFSALYTDRVYRKKLPFDEAMSVIEQSAGTQLDSDLVRVFRTISLQDIDSATATI